MDVDGEEEDEQTCDEICAYLARQRDELEPPPIQNVLCNHPHYRSWDELGLPNLPSSATKILGVESVCTADIEVSALRVVLDVTKPFNGQINAVADTGANIDVINMVTAMQYSNYLRVDKRGLNVRTGNGMRTVREYLPLHIKNNGKTLVAKLYVIPDFPYDYLIGRSTLRFLDYHLVKGSTVYHHDREVLDNADDLLEERAHDQYPIEGEKPEVVAAESLNLSKNKKLNEWIIGQIGENAKLAHIRSQTDYDTGKISQFPFHIKLKKGVDTTPIKSPEYPLSVQGVEEIERQLKYLLRIGFIAKSVSPWRSPTFIVPKKTGDWRIVFDYRKLNAITEKIAYPMQTIQSLADKFRGKRWISTIDLKCGYWHCPVAPEDRPKTAFAFNGKLYEWNVMPFGPTNAPAHFQMVMNEIFGQLPFVNVYLDDIAVLSETAEQHRVHLQKVFDLMSKYKIKMRADKCHWGQQSVEYLGWQIDHKGMKPTKRYKDKVMNVPVPTNKKELHRFVGMIGYLHRYLPDIQKELKPFYAMINLPNDRKFVWTADDQSRFERIKSMVNRENILMLPDMNKPFSVYCDASIDGIGCVLTQKYKSTAHDPETNEAKTVLVDRPVQFCSKLFGKTERNWHVSEQEIFAVVYALEKWRPYLIHRRFTVYTDHKNLAELFNRAKNFKAGKLYRWAVRLQDYDFDARYIEGKKNIFADYLSRDALTLSYCPYHTQKSVAMQNKDIKLLYERHLAHQSILNKNILYPHSDNPSDPPSILILDRDPPRPYQQNSLQINIKNDKILLPTVSDQYRDHANDVVSDSDSDSDIESMPLPDTSSLSSYINPSQSLDISDGRNDVYSIPSPIPSLEGKSRSAV